MDSTSLFPGMCMQLILEIFPKYTQTCVRLGLKGPVYLKGKDGEPNVPLSLISGKQSNGKNDDIRRGLF